MRRWPVLGLILLLAGCGNALSYRLPYAGPVERSIEPGAYLPGTEIQYVARTEKSARISIGGVEATKKIGDSLDRKSEMVPGASVDQTLRVIAIGEEALHAAGTVRVIVTNPQVQAEPANRSAPVNFKLPVGYRVEKGQTIPGTTIAFLGKTDEGAHLGNIEGYAYRQIGDSLLWEGKLREGLWLELDLRTLAVTDDLLDLVGTADLWIVPQGNR